MLTNNQSLEKILVIRLSSLGDVLLTSKLIRNLKNKFPESNIIMIVNKEYEDLIRYNKNINLYYLYNKSSLAEINNLKNKIKESEPDLIIDLQNNSRSNELIKEINCIKKSFDKRIFFKLGLVYLKLNKNKKFKAIPDLYCNTVNDIIEKTDDKGSELWFEDTIDYSDIENRQYNYNGKLKIAIAPGATFKTKRLPKDILINLLKKLENSIEAEFTLLGGISEKSISKEIEKEIECINYVGQLSILETAKEIKNSNLLITNDTGLMHIASAVKTPVVVFYGGTVQNFGFIPYKTPNLILENDLWCRPCSHIGKNYCPLIHFNCMKKFNPDEISFKIIEFLNNLYKVDKVNI